jgi:hypothetical protein
VCDVQQRTFLAVERELLERFWKFASFGGYDVMLKHVRHRGADDKRCGL